MKQKFFQLFIISTSLFFIIGYAISKEIVEVKNNCISIIASNIKAKNIFKEIEKKTSLKFMIYEGVDDKTVSIDIKDVPVHETTQILKKMGYNNIATVYNKKQGNIFYCLLPQGKNINSFIKNNNNLVNIAEASFNYGLNNNKIINNIKVKGKEIETFNKNNASISFIKDEIILKFTKNMPLSDVEKELKKYNLAKIPCSELSKIGYIKVKIDNSTTLNDVIPKLRKNPYIAVSEPDYILKSMSKESLVDNSWYISESKFDSAWKILRDFKDVNIGILDTGIDENNKAFEGIILKGYNIYSKNFDTTDNNGHGTYISGIIASSLSGVNNDKKNCKLLPVKIIGENGLGTYEDTASGIIWAADNNADIINISAGGYAKSNLLLDAIDYAISKGCIIIASGGNEGINMDLYPAAYPEVIAVSALGIDGKIWPHSNQGDYIDVCAPGENIASFGIGGNYIYSSGTSASCAIVSALAAMIISENNDLPSTYIPELIFQSAKDIGTAGKDIIYGFGKIDAINALSSKIKAFHDVLLRNLKIETNIFKQDEIAYIGVDIVNAGTYSPESCIVELFQIEKQKNKKLIQKKELEIINLNRLYFLWKPEKIHPDIQFEIKLSVKDDNNLLNNIIKSPIVYLEQENGLIAIKHKSEPKEQVHQFIAGEGWELIRRYMPGYENMAKVLMFDGVELVKDDTIMVSEIDMPVTQTQTYSAKNHDRVFYQSKNMVTEFNEHIGKRMLFKIGNKMDFDLLDNEGPIFNNINSEEIPDYQDYDGEKGAYSLTYSGKLDKDLAKYARSLPFSIYYSTFQYEGDRDDEFGEFIETTFDVSLPWSWVSSGEIYSSEGTFIGLENNPGGLWGKLTDPKYSDITIGNDDIIEGAHEEDVYDIVTNHAHFMGLLNADNFYHHFWDTDTYNNGKFNDGYSSGDASDDNSAITVSEVLFKYAVDSYVSGDKDKGYYILGRVVHLLEDMGAVPHVHNDAHPFYDAYECVMSKVYDNETFHSISDFKNGKSVYLSWHVDVPKRELKPDVEPMSADDLNEISEHFTELKPLTIISIEELRNDLNPETNRAYAEFKKLLEKENVQNIEENWKSRTDLFRIFYSLAEIADDFPSDDCDGDIISQSGDVDKDMYAYKYYAPVVQPAIIEHLAALYNLFWRKTHGFVKGFVRDFNGQAIHDAEVVLCGLSNYTTTTDENGAFYFYDIESEGLYHLNVKKANYDSYNGAEDLFNVNVGQTSEMNIRLWNEDAKYTEEQLREAVNAAEAAKDEIIIAKENLISELNQTISNNNELISNLNEQVDNFENSILNMISKEKLNELILEERNKWDVNHDNMAGLEEVIKTLKDLSGINSAK